MEEVWKDIGIKKYAVSNMGNVRGANGIRLLKPHDNGYGYKRINICDNGIKAKLVHILVMEAFIGERPIGYDIDHINRLRDDNRLDNLRYCSRRENCVNSSKWRTDIEETDPMLRTKIYHKKYKEQNKEKLIQTKKQYWENNKEKLLASRNKEKIKQYNKIYYQQKKKEAIL